MILKKASKIKEFFEKNLKKFLVNIKKEHLQYEFGRKTKVSKTEIFLRKR